MQLGNKHCLGLKNSLGYRHTPEAREKIRQANIGKQISPEHREKLRQARLGHKASPETREKISQFRRGHKLSPEQREKRRQMMFGIKPHLGCKHSPETCEKLRQLRLRQHFPTKMTSIECRLHDEFKKRRLHFEMHKTMFGRFQPDFVFESARLIVQADGDYWHSRPDMKEREARFAIAAHAAGWSVWRFGEKEIHMHAAACARAVARFVRDH
jgi:very-short-patch-repair endonuclease